MMSRAPKAHANIPSQRKACLAMKSACPPSPYTHTHMHPLARTGCPCLCHCLQVAPEDQGTKAALGWKWQLRAQPPSTAPHTIHANELTNKTPMSPCLQVALEEQGTKAALARKWQLSPLSGTLQTAIPLFLHCVILHCLQVALEEQGTKAVLACNRPLSAPQHPSQQHGPTAVGLLRYFTLAVAPQE